MKTIEETKPDMNEDATRTRAWRMDHEAILAGADEESRRNDSTVEAWLVHAPWAHPMWPVHMVAVIHLRAVEGVKDPVIRLEGATHEIVVYAVSPEKPTYIDARNDLLFPVNFVGQFAAKDDEAARDRLRFTVGEIVKGQLNPDTDGFRQWILRFGDNSVKKPDPGTVAAALAGVLGVGGGGIGQLLEGLAAAAEGEGKPEPTPGCDCPFCRSLRHVH